MMASIKALPNGQQGNSEWLQLTPGERFKIRTSVKNTAGLYSMLEFVVESRNGVPMHIHKNEDEHFLVLDGTLHMANGDQRSDVRPVPRSPSARAYLMHGAICRTVLSECLSFFRPGTSRKCSGISSIQGASILQPWRPMQIGSALSSSVPRCSRTFTRSPHPDLSSDSSRHRDVDRRVVARRASARERRTRALNRTTRTIFHETTFDDAPAVACRRRGGGD